MHSKYWSLKNNKIIKFLITIQNLNTWNFLNNLNKENSKLNLKQQQDFLMNLEFRTLKKFKNMKSK